MLQIPSLEGMLISWGKHLLIKLIPCFSWPDFQSYIYITCSYTTAPPTRRTDQSRRITKLCKIAALIRPAIVTASRQRT